MQPVSKPWDVRAGCHASSGSPTPPLNRWATESQKEEVASLSHMASLLVLPSLLKDAYSASRLPCFEVDAYFPT